MGVFSKVHRFREAGQDANVNNVARFGQPTRSLFTSSKVFSLHQKTQITDEMENAVYYVKSKAVSLHDRTTITDASGAKVADIEKKLISLHERHFITMADGTTFEMSNEILHIIKDITNIEGLGWQLRGNILALNFELYDRNNNILAVIGQKMFSLHDKYCLDIYSPENEQKIVALLVTLQHMIKDRETDQAAASAFDDN